MDMSIKATNGLADHSFSADFVDFPACGNAPGQGFVSQSDMDHNCQDALAVGKEDVHITYVLRYKNDAVLARIQKELELSDADARILFDDMLRFLWLCGTKKGEGLVPPPPIDEAWHEFIMFMRDYEEFCEKYFGRLLYHRPNRPEDPPRNGTEVPNSVAVFSEHLGTLSANWNFPHGSTCNEKCDHTPGKCKDSGKDCYGCQLPS